MIGRLFRRGSNQTAPQATQQRSFKQRFFRGLRSAFGIDRLLGMAVLGVFVGLHLTNPAPIENLRLKMFDSYQQIKPRPIPPPEQKAVTIIDIDEDSLDELGQWPWPRDMVAQIVQNLMQMGAVLVAFDVVFPEPDRMNPASIADRLEGLDDEARAELKSLPSNDEIFAEVVGNSRVVLGQAGNWQHLERAPRDPLPNRVVVKGPQPDTSLPEFPTLIRNVPVVERAAAGHGIFSLTPENDGIVRRIPSVFRNGRDYYPALSIEMLRVAFQRPAILVESNVAGVLQIGIHKDLKLPTDPEGRIWPYFSKRDVAKYVPAKDVLDGTAPVDMIRGKLTIIGTSAVGLLDIRSIPTEPIIPGVEAHVQLIESALLGQYLIRPNYAPGLELCLIFFVGVLMIWLVPSVGARWTMILFVVVAGGSAAGSWYAFTEHRFMFDAAVPVIAIMIIYTLLTYTGYAKEERQRRQVRDAFSHYLSPAMVERLAEDPTQLKLGGETRNMTMLFCDVRGFTSLSEMYDAAGLTNLINKLLTPLTEVILARKGTVDKYMGDCIMAFWNAPMDDPEHARNACQTALAMHAAMGPFNDLLKDDQRGPNGEEPEDFQPMQVGIGVNTGDVAVGNMGSDLRFDYSVLGDSVNLAARLEGQSKTYSVSIVLGEATQEMVPEMAALELDLIQVKGKTEAVRIFVLLGDEQHAQGNAFQALRSANDEMLTAYRAQDWPGARKAIQACREVMDGHDLGEFYDVYEERVAEFEATPPPPDWDGVYIAETK